MAAILILPRDRASGLRSGRQTAALTTPREPSPSNPVAAVGRAVRVDIVAQGAHKREKIVEADCTLRARLVLSPDGLVRVIDLQAAERGPAAERAGVMANVLRNAEQGSARARGATRAAVARLFGFRSWAQLWAFASHPDRRPRPDAQGHVVRDVVGWA